VAVVASGAQGNSSATHDFAHHFYARATVGALLAAPQLARASNPSRTAVAVEFVAAACLQAGAVDYASRVVALATTSTAQKPSGFSR